MAWNPSPKVADCREIARKWGYDQVVVLAINSRSRIFETVSYGETRALCEATKEIAERIHEDVASGKIEIDA